MLKLSSLTLENSGNKIVYRYNYDNRLSKYFRTNQINVTYQNINLSEVPDSLLVIPFLGSVLPVSWFVGFDVFVEEIDEDYYTAAESIKDIFIKNFPLLDKNKSTLRYGIKVRNTITPGRPAILFSGGVDSNTTFLRHINENPHLVTVHGADIRTLDKEQFQNLQKHLQQSALLKAYEKHFIETNIRNFYTHRLNLFFDDYDWWGRVQHGLAITSLLAPLSYLKNIVNIYIASTVTEMSPFSWGSMPSIDNEIKWANASIHHDGFELRRTDKVKILVDKVKESGVDIQVKVCYSNRHSGLNCSHCEKCCRTILLIILCGGNPNRFGFNASAKIYDKILKKISGGFTTDLMKYFWGVVLNEKIAESPAPFIFDNEKEEMYMLQLIRNKLIENNTKALRKKPVLDRIRFRLQLQYPGLHNYAVVIFRKLMRIKGALLSK